MYTWKVHLVIKLLLIPPVLSLIWLEHQESLEELFEAEHRVMYLTMQMPMKLRSPYWVHRLTEYKFSPRMLTLLSQSHTLLEQLRNDLVEI